MNPDAGILVNGFQKCGTHALLKGCYLLGFNAEHGHFPYDAPLPDGTTRHIFIKRDPRNALASWIRRFSPPLTAVSFVASFRECAPGKSLVDAMSTYEGWLSDPNVLLIKFEDLIESDVELRRVAAFLDTPYSEDAFKNLPGHTRTWNPQHVDYRDIWSSEVAAIWTDEGGDDMVKRWGYV